MEYTRRKLKTMLTKSVCEVTFKKIDGSKRTLRCTLIPNRMPKLKHPKKKIKILRGVLPVFEVDLKAWRSFRIKSVKRVKIV